MNIFVVSKEICSCEETRYKVEIPHHCPYCSCSTNIQVINSDNIEYQDESKVIFVYYLCSHCNNIIVCKYSLVYDKRLQIYTSQTKLEEIIPKPSLKMNFEKSITELSYKFCNIYNEAYLAEQQELFEICGIGYRKALEFLVKDFAISQHPDKADSIKKISLANCIETYIDYDKIKTLAKASAWLGNDETHYIRKHEDYRLEDLKSFINAMVSYINMELEFNKANNLTNK